MCFSNNFDCKVSFRWPAIQAYPEVPWNIFACFFFSISVLRSRKNLYSFTLNNFCSDLLRSCQCCWHNALLSQGLRPNGKLPWSAFFVEQNNVVIVRFEHNRCYHKLRSNQLHHIARNFPDNFLKCSDC